MASRKTKKARSLAAKKGWETRRKREREEVSRIPKGKKRPAKKPESFASAEKRRRSKASKKGWITRRGIISRDKEALRDKIRELQEQIEEQKRVNSEIERVSVYLHDRFSKVMMLDSLPPRLIQETQMQHTVRVIQDIINQGVYDRDDAYREVSKHTGLSTREVYTLFCYIGADYVA